MNIKDVRDGIKNYEEVDDAFNWLWNKQFELYEKYKHIEEMPEKWPMNIHTSETQIWIKDFFWRVWEELMEAFESLIEYSLEIDPEKKNLYYDHYLEELSDALHFYLEIYVLLDRHINIEETIEEAKQFFLSKEDDILEIVIDMNHKIGLQMGLAANKLRNKKWKVSQVLVDVDDFNQYLDDGFINLIYLIAMSINPVDDLRYEFLNLYHLKMVVNKFRQRSNY